MWLLVVSFTGRSWTAFMPTLAAQPTKRRRSPKSPIPQLCSLRRENTGTTTPANRGKIPPIPAQMSSRRFRPFPPSARRLQHCSHSTVPSTCRRTYLYSKASPASLSGRAKIQQFPPTGCKRRALLTSQAPNSGVEPSTAQYSPSGRSGAVRQNKCPGPTASTGAV